MLQRPDAYPVPFRFIRDHAPHYGLRNLSAERLRGVTFSLLGPGLLAAPPFVHLAPGATAWIAVHGDDLPRASALVVRWLRENGDEYLWRVVF